MTIDYQNIIENDFEQEIYELKHKEILNYLTTFGKSDFWTIVNNVGGSERRMIRLLNEMVKCKEIVFEDKRFNIDKNDNKYKSLDFDFIKKEMDTIVNNRPNPTLYFDQRPVTCNTTIKRVEYLLNRNDVYNKKIVFLGDDDLTSIALGLSGVKCDITVLDIDKRLIDYINKIAKIYNLNIKAYEFNAMEEVPKYLKNTYDVLATDPTPEETPLTVFLNCALDLIKEDNSIIYTSLYSSAMKKTMGLQRVINNMNLYITDLIPNFTKYKAIESLYRDSDKDLFSKYKVSFNEDSICFTETLFRMERINETHKIPIKYVGKDIFGKATKRVLKDKECDTSLEDSEYLSTVRDNIKNMESKEYTSK